MPIAASRFSRLRWVFVGSDGIRAGWSILIFLLIMAVPAAAIGFVIKHWHLVPKPKQEFTIRPWLLVIREAVSLVFLAGATAVMAWIERRSFWSYGMALDRAGAKFAVGLAAGFACLSTLVAMLAAGGYLVFDGAALHGVAILGLALLWAVGFILVALSEETLFRGYIQSTLTRGMGFWPASVVGSALFGLAHVPNPGESLLGLVGVVAAGLVFCLLLRVSGSLWLAIGFHAAWDWAQSFFYGTPDSGLLAEGHFLVSHAAGSLALSGGKAGPEGSLLAAPVMIGGLLALAWVYRRGHADRVREVRLGGMKPFPQTPQRLFRSTCRHSLVP